MTEFGDYNRLATIT